MQVYLAQEKDQEIWDTFVVESLEGSFLQSWGWGDFQSAAGFHTERIIVRDEGRILAVCFLVEHHLPLGKSYWYAPWGPVTAGNLSNEDYFEILQSIRGHLLKERGFSQVFLRLEPRINPEREGVYKQSKFVLLGRGIQPKDTSLIDLGQIEDELLRNMHSKTRYNIRVAMRHGVEVVEETNSNGLDAFLKMAHEIEKKEMFHFHKDSYYRMMLTTLAPKNMLEILLAKHKGEPLAAGIFIKFGNTYTYAHGSSHKMRPHVMAPYLMHWEAFSRAKKNGFFWYDFFGITADKSLHHPWAGITRFKRGFGGQEKHFIGAADVIFDPFQYRLFNMARGFREILKK